MSSSVHFRELEKNQRVGKEPLQLTDGITYGYLVNDMLNSIERIADGLKRIIFFCPCGLSVKLLVNLLMMDLLIDHNLPTNIFSTDSFHP